jgi:RNA polymerase sigma-70 factor, ECF subfamily
MQRHQALISQIASRFGLHPGDVNEMHSQLMRRLFVSSDESQPKFAQYVGRGQLGGLVRVAVTRHALTLVSAKDRKSQEVSPNSPGIERDVSDKFAKAELQQLMKQALEQSADALTERQRSILRMHYVKHANIDDIGAVYRVHRATAARWLLEARTCLVESAREAFLLQAALEEHELAEVASMVESQLSMTWSRLFIAKA